jgi:hypothetical protein
MTMVLGGVEFARRLGRGNSDGVETADLGGVDI